MTEKTLSEKFKLSDDEVDHIMSLASILYGACGNMDVTASHITLEHDMLMPVAFVLLAGVEALRECE